MSLCLSLSLSVSLCLSLSLSVSLCLSLSLSVSLCLSLSLSVCVCVFGLRCGISGLGPGRCASYSIGVGATTKAFPYGPYISRL